tara:strand:+ start:1554 stop:1676 length:123 start_codon:yes stop_codon:yes gene_type:complete
MQLKLTDFGLKLDLNQKTLADFDHTPLPKGQSTLFAKVSE